MSDKIIPMHTLACDWPGCKEAAKDGIYNCYGIYYCWESYDTAVQMFADQDDSEWLHIDGKDYCPKHWHLDEKLNRVVGPRTRKDEQS